jgi:hypothetical protein
MTLNQCSRVTLLCSRRWACIHSGLLGVVLCLGPCCGESSMESVTRCLIHHACVYAQHNTQHAKVRGVLNIPQTSFKPSSSYPHAKPPPPSAHLSTMSLLPLSPPPPAHQPCHHCVHTGGAGGSGRLIGYGEFTTLSELHVATFATTRVASPTRLNLGTTSCSLPASHGCSPTHPDFADPPPPSAPLFH